MSDWRRSSGGSALGAGDTRDTDERSVLGRVLKIADFSPEAVDTLARCDEAGVVLEFVRLEPEGRDDVGRAAHQQAAVKAVAETYARWARRLEGELVELDRHPELFEQREAQHRIQARDSASPFERWRARLRLLPSVRRVRAQTQRLLRRTRQGALANADAARRFDPAGLTGRRIGVDEFFGQARSAGSPPSRVDHGAHSETLDFTYAFSDPPYSLRITGDELDGLFPDVVRHVLGRPSETTEIWSWDTGWSPYFDDGREWWGTGLWTLDVQDAIVAVLASSTD